MKRYILGATALLLLAAVPARAVVSIDLGASDENSWTVNYTFQSTAEGADSMEVLPYDFPMEITRCEPEKGGLQLRFDPINENEEGAPKYLVHFPSPVEPGGKFRYTVEAEMSDPKSYFEDSAKLTFLYQTAHEVYVILPAGYFPIYTDEPMEVKQEKGRVVLNSVGGKRRPVVIFAVKCFD